MAANQALRHGAAVLARAGLEAPRREARLLLAAALGVPKEALLASPDEEAPTATFAALLARRAAREPLALILGHGAFWTLDLLVSPATLVPRADSETLIEAAIEALPARERVGAMLDLGTGTGCLLLAALSEFPAAWGLGIDLAEAAAALAWENARRTGLAGRVGVAVADWAAPLAGHFDLVLSNPPYVARGDLAGLMPEVRDHEPARALDGGPDGLDAYRAILAALPALLAPGGVAVLELGQGQDPAVTAIAAERGLAVAGLRNDLSGIRRALVLQNAAVEKTFGTTARRL